MLPHPNRIQQPHQPNLLLNEMGLTSCKAMIHKLLVMAVFHCHMFDRWTTIWNLFNEKDLGKLQIDQLCTLHIIEVDYNLLFKWFGHQGDLK